MAAGGDDPRLRHGVPRRLDRQPRTAGHRPGPRRRIAGLQWTVNALHAHARGADPRGRLAGRPAGPAQVFVVGVSWFAVASVLCAVAPTIEVLVAARGLQGIGAALLTPGSLAIISASFDAEDRGRAIGIWSGLAGVTTAIGPLVGGWLVDMVGWRSIFWINVPLAVAVVVIALEARAGDEGEQDRIDFAGAALSLSGSGLPDVRAGGRGMGAHRRRARGAGRLRPAPEAHAARPRAARAVHRPGVHRGQHLHVRHLRRAERRLASCWCSSFSTWPATRRSRRGWPRFPPPILMLLFSVAPARSDSASGHGGR